MRRALALLPCALALPAGAATLPLSRALQDGNSDWIGYAAAVLTTVAFVPQALHTLRSRDTRGISLAMYAIFTIGVACWLGYGLLLGSWPMILANVVTFVLSAAILALKLRHG